MAGAPLTPLRIVEPQSQGLPASVTHARIDRLLRDEDLQKLLPGLHVDWSAPATGTITYGDEGYVIDDRISGQVQISKSAVTVNLGIGAAIVGRRADFEQTLRAGLRAALDERYTPPRPRPTPTPSAPPPAEAALPAAPAPQPDAPPDVPPPETPPEQVGDSPSPSETPPAADQSETASSVYTTTADYPGQPGDYPPPPAEAPPLVDAPGGEVPPQPIGPTNQGQPLYAPAPPQVVVVTLPGTPAAPAPVSMPVAALPIVLAALGFFGMGTLLILSLRRSRRSR